MYRWVGDLKFYTDIRKQIFYDHQDAYSGDTLWLEQAESIFPELIKIVENKNLNYDDVSYSPSCESQGCFYIGNDEDETDDWY